MSLIVEKAPAFIADFEREYAWYLKEASEEVAKEYLAVVFQTLQMLAKHPGLGPIRRFRHPKLKDIRSFRVNPPFHRHLIFYRFDSTTLHAERVIHGMRDLPRRLVEPPGFGED